MVSAITNNEKKKNKRSCRDTSNEKRLKERYHNKGRKTEETYIIDKKMNKESYLWIFI